MCVDPVEQRAKSNERLDMKRDESTVGTNNEPLDRADLLRQARGVFGADSTLQLYGSGGRIVAEDGRRLPFGSMAELKDLIDKERTEPHREPLADTPCWYAPSFPR